MRFCGRGWTAVGEAVGSTVEIGVIGSGEGRGSLVAVGLGTVGETVEVVVSPDELQATRNSKAQDATVIAARIGTEAENFMADPSSP